MRCKATNLILREHFAKLLAAMSKTKLCPASVQQRPSRDWSGLSCCSAKRFNFIFGKNKSATHATQWATGPGLQSQEALPSRSKKLKQRRGCPTVRPWGFLCHTFNHSLKFFKLNSPNLKRRKLREPRGVDIKEILIVRIIPSWTVEDPFPSFS